MLIRENRNYIFIPKNFIGMLLTSCTVILMFGFIWSVINTPDQFKKGIYPEISNMYTVLKEKDKELLSRIDDNEIEICSLNLDYFDKKYCQELVRLKHYKEIIGLEE